jgi:iron-sulfur cluster repair protein YtfE (RIC family)
MSQTLVDDRTAAEAVVAHHAQLADTLGGFVRALHRAAEGGDAPRLWQHREGLVRWLHGELLPHAYAEEAGLYPVAAEQPAGRLLIEGMRGEHTAIAALVDETEDATTAVALVAAARALAAVFAVHLAKENELVVPLIVAAENVSLAHLLEGMHDLIGEPTDGAAGGAGCGGHCDCGGAG